MKKMIDWVEENIKENLSLEEMSYYVGYSSFYCSAKFHEYAGVTFKQYIAKRRLSLAKIEIKSNNRKILDIALDYGFSSQEAFTRAFVCTYGCTPYKYRKKHNTLLNMCIR
jgi:AraC family multidrug resistance transcriptional activator